MPKLSQHDEFMQKFGAATRVACLTAINQMAQQEAPVTDIIIIAVALRRRDDGVGTYLASHYEGCPACISEFGGQHMLDHISTGFLQMTKVGHDKAEHS